MTIFAERLNQMLSMRGMTAAELSRKTGIGEATISNYRAGRITPKNDNAYLIASALKVSPSWLLGYDVNPELADAALMDLFEMLSPEQQKQVLDYMRFLLSNQR